MKNTLIALLCLLSALVLSCSLAGDRDYVVKQRYPHDNQAFTQGLVYTDGRLYEGTGLRGQSEIRLVDLDSGRVIRHRRLPDSIFGEGITVYKDRIVQLSYTSGRGFVYDKQSLRLTGGFDYPGQGWGLTHNGDALIMSDGTHVLRFLDPDTYRVVSRLEVLDGNEPVSRLNELEFIQGYLYANIWLSDRIAVIDPQSGRVVRWIDLSGLWQKADPDNVLNGIAYRAETGRLLVTGKRWPWLFEIEIQE